MNLDRIHRIGTLFARSVTIPNASISQLTLAMNISPPEMRQNAAMISEGGREGRKDVGGERYAIRYVMPRAREAPTSMLPQRACSVVDTLDP